MNTITLPTNDEMYRAVIRRDSNYDGLFVIAVKTTGIFCRPTCPAKKPLRKNVLFFANTADALAAGYRACKRCRPLDASGTTPDWLDALLKNVDGDPHRRWTNREIRGLGVDPSRVNRWFKTHHGLTFLGYLRCRRLAGALAQLSAGDDPARVALDAGYESLSGFRDAFQKWLGTTPGQIENGGPVLRVNRIPTPLGPMVAAADNKHLYLLEFADRRMLQTQITRLEARLKCRFLPGGNALIERTAREVAEYFTGSRRGFDVPFRMVGTPFQQQIWELLLKIPYGETSSYERIAAAACNPMAHRAVGRANGDNRLAIIIPCHRVVRSDGRLGGYGGGLRRKQWMLQHELAVLHGDSHGAAP